MNIEPRNQYGFPTKILQESLSKTLFGFDLFGPSMRNKQPIDSKFERAKRYAAAAKERNKPQCACQECRMKELEPAVIQITQRWKS